MADGLFTPQGVLSPEEVLQRTGFTQQGAFAAPTVGELQAGLRQAGIGGQLPQRRRQIGSTSLETGMGAGGIAGAIRDMKSRRIISAAVKEGVDPATEEGARELGNRLMERGLVSQGQAQLARAAEIQKANITQERETFGELEEVKKVGDKVIVGQRSSTTGKLANFQVVDSEEFDNLRKQMEAERKRAEEGTVPARPSEEEVTSAGQFTKKFNIGGVNIDKLVGGLSDDEREELNREIARGAKTYQARIKDAGGSVSFNDAMGEVARSIISGRVRVDKGYLYDSASLQPLSPDEAPPLSTDEDPLGLR